MLRKKSSILLSAIGFVLSFAIVHADIAVADDYKDSTRVTPYFGPQFEFSVAALALKPGASNLNYVIYNKGLPLQSPGWTEKEIRPGYSLAFELGARYRFSADKDLSLDWTHLNSTASASVAAPNTSYFLGPDYEIGPIGIPIRNATGNAQFKYDVVNLNVGQSLYLDRHVVMRFFGGLSNGYLREQVQASYTGNVPAGIYAGPFSTQQQVTSNFTGLGPRFGVEASYNADNGFGFLGEAAVSALIGSVNAKTAYISSGQELLIKYGQTTNYQIIQDQNFTQVVPGLDGKLGLNYKHAIGKETVFMIEGGYEAAVYINAINQYLPGTLVAGAGVETGGIFVATMNHTLSNYSVQGPYLKAVLRF